MTTTSSWNGPPCSMCNGTGRDHTYRDRGDGTTTRDVPTGLPCRACNGHGHEPAQEQE